VLLLHRLERAEARVGRVEGLLRHAEQQAVVAARGRSGLQNSWRREHVLIADAGPRKDLARRGWRQPRDLPSDDVRVGVLESIGEGAMEDRRPRSNEQLVEGDLLRRVWRLVVSHRLAYRVPPDSDRLGAAEARCPTRPARGSPLAGASAVPSQRTRDGALLRRSGGPDVLRRAQSSLTPRTGQERGHPAATRCGCTARSTLAGRLQSGPWPRASLAS